MDSAPRTPAELPSEPVPFWKDTLWRVRLALWSIAALSFALQSAGLMVGLALNLAVLLTLAVALLALCVASVIHEEPGPAVLDISAIPLLLAWAGAIRVSHAVV